MADMHLSGTQSTIMVVDDNPDMVTIIKTILEIKGYGVQSAYNGLEVFNLLQEQKSDLILLDIMMPHMDGLQVLTRIKGNPDTASIPVILLSVKALDEDIRVGYKFGADEYITKPFTRTQLMTSINRHLRGPDTRPSPPIASA